METEPTGRYVAELYLSRDGGSEAARAAGLLGAAAAELSDEGVRVRHLRTIFVPEDETCFHLFEADSAEAVGAAGDRARVAFGRIAQAVEIEAS